MSMMSTLMTVMRKELRDLSRDRRTLLLTLLFGPLLFPIARSMGIHEVHYSMVVILAMGLGLFAPPFGVGYYAACAIGKVSPDAGMRKIWPYMGALLLGTILVAAVPWISIGFLGGK